MDASDSSPTTKDPYCLPGLPQRHSCWTSQRKPRKDMKTLESHVLRKRACVVRWGAGGKGLLPQYLACGLPDVLIGFVGPRQEAEEIKRQLAVFLSETLKLTLSEEPAMSLRLATEHEKG